MELVYMLVLFGCLVFATSYIIGYTVCDYFNQKDKTNKGYRFDTWSIVARVKLSHGLYYYVRQKLPYHTVTYCRSCGIYTKLSDNGSTKCIKCGRFA